MVFSPSQANEWRGISPLRSTRADVERLLGAPKTAGQGISSYDIEGGLVSVIYSTGPCKDKTNAWNVPLDTVIGIRVYLRVRPKLDDLKLDESKYAKAIEGDDLNIVTYRNDTEGIAYNVYEPDGSVSFIRYSPAAKDNNLRCNIPPDPDDGVADGLVDVRKFDSYSSITQEEEKKRLDDFATQLRHYDPNAKGYIIVYAGAQKCAGVAQTIANRIRDYLVGQRGLNPARIITIDGGCREKLTVELWVRPEGAPAPKVIPTNSPKELRDINSTSQRRNQRTPNSRCKQHTF